MGPRVTTIDQPRLVTTAAEAHEYVRSQQGAGKRVGLVATMGALHAGHISLVRRSTEECDATVVTIFVNPLQFGPGEDFHAYPRTLAQDLELLAPLAVDVVLAPAVGEMYPAGFATHVEVDGLAGRWEGAFRPGHFRGVITVVLKLLNIVPADRAYFGQKDYQQFLAIQRMAADLNLATEIIMCPIVREADGLALSSRNAYLSADERRRALVLSRSLQVAREMFASGDRDAHRIADAMRKLISAEPGVQIDYVTLADPATLAELTHVDRAAVALVAARIGSARLIDNEILGGEAS